MFNDRVGLKHTTGVWIFSVRAPVYIEKPSFCIYKYVKFSDKCMQTAASNIYMYVRFAPIHQ